MLSDAIAPLHSHCLPLRLLYMFRSVVASWLGAKLQ